MSFGYGLYIAKSETESLYVVDVARVSAIEFLKYPLLRFLAHPDTVVHYLNGKHIIMGNAGLNIYMQVAF